jgi:hypothetical protein
MRIKIIYILHYIFLLTFCLRFSLPSCVFVLFFFFFISSCHFLLFFITRQNDLSKTTYFCSCHSNTNNLTDSVELLRATDRCKVSYLSPRWTWWHDSTCANDCFIFLSAFRCNKDKDYARCQTSNIHSWRTVCRYLWCSLSTHLATDWREVIAIGEEALVNVSASRNNKTKQPTWLKRTLVEGFYCTAASVLTVHDSDVYMPSN